MEELLKINDKQDMNKYEKLLKDAFQFKRKNIKCYKGFKY